MAACCTSIGVGGKFCLTMPSNVLPRPSPHIPLRCCSTQVSQRRSRGKRLSRRPGSIETRAQGRRGTSWGWERLIIQQEKTESGSSPTSCCLPTDVSSAASIEQNVVEGSGTGMSIDERDAIIAFEEGNSGDYVQSSSEDEEPKASQAMEKSEEDVVATERQEETYETVSLNAVKGQGATIANAVSLFVPLLDIPSPGDGRMLAATGSAVLERVEEEVGKLQELDGVDGQSLFEILRLVKLLRMDIQLVAASRKDGTLIERLEQTKARCLQLLTLARTL